MHIVMLVLAEIMQQRFRKMSGKTDLNENYPRGETDEKME